MHSYLSVLTVLSVILLFSFNIALGQRVVTSPETCLRDSDCDEFSEYCGTDYLCYKRGTKGAECLNNVQCGDGLYCGAVNDRRLCVPQKALFEECDHSFEESCAIDGRFTYKCSPVTYTCGYTGFDGETCFRPDDCQTGYYCKDSGNINGGKCTSKRQVGEKCSSFSDSFQCDGYCAGGDNVDVNDSGVCVLGSQIGESCTQDNQCYGYETALSDPNTRGLSKIVCNIAKGSIGVCEHERDLLKKEGLQCNPGKDTCDAARGLSCRSTPTGHKCMFNKFDKDQGNFGVRFCDINGGNLSKCNLQNGIPTECRRQFDEGSPFGYLFTEFFQCLRKTEIITQGLPCNDVAYAQCESGTKCLSVPGVQTVFVKFLRQPKFCVKVRKEGEKCYSKFRFACEKGLKCEKNVCVKGKPDDKTTHVYDNVACDSMPCTPGLQCVKQFGHSSCQREEIEKSKGACYSTALTTTVSFYLFCLFLSLFISFYLFFTTFLRSGPTDCVLTFPFLFCISPP